MQWKFWKRWPRKVSSSAVRTEERAPGSTGFPSFLSLGGAKEILALQRMIGNQAVLRIVAPDRASANFKRTPG